MTPPVGPRQISVAAVAIVFAGGAMGTAARYGLEVLAPMRTSSGQWPVGTFVANLAGAFILGMLLEFLTAAGSGDDQHRRARLLLGTGFCGGLTTYSALAVEADLLVRSDAGLVAVTYLVGSVVAGLAVTSAGIAVAAWRRRGRGGSVAS